MNKLEAIGLVQYFLYERIDLELGWNTAFLGPNGTGKTALLDALQIVLLAADSNRTHFNASGEGKKRARSLREYCLGVYGQTEDERFRPASNTYINLVFRDEQTGVPVTAGVSLAAQADNPDITFNSLYILPGVALPTSAHMEKDGGRESILPWRKFQHIAGDLCRMEGTTPMFTSNREEFSRRLFVEHLASAGERPNVRAIRASFARSLKLNKDVDDLNETLRQHLIEQRLTNVKQFRARLEQFREVRELIRRISERIERSSSVIDKYAIVQRERTSQANLEALRAVYDSERVGEQLGQADAHIETLTEQLNLAALALERAKVQTQQEDASRQRAQATLNRDPEYLKQANQAERLNDLEGALRTKQSTLSRTLETLVGAIVGGGRALGLERHRGAFEEAASQVIDLQALSAQGQLPPVQALQSAMLAVAELHELTRKALGAAEAEQKSARDQRRDAKTALERAQHGLTALRESTITLQRHLADAGIQAVPVCDLVSITDPQWQPALEAYLSTHVDALLVPREQELAAIELYKGLRGANRVYRVKLAMPSRGRPWQAPGGGRFAAQLIEGQDKDAVRYLQGELGKLALATSSEQLRVGFKAISIEGMVSSGGGVERLQLAPQNELKLGRTDQGFHRSAAEAAWQQAEQATAAADAAVQQLQIAQTRLAPFANAESTRQSVEALFNESQESTRIVDELKDALVATQTDQLSTLQENAAEAGRRYTKAVEVQNKYLSETVKLQTQLEGAQSARENFVRQLSLVNATEANARLHPLHNPNEVERYRERYDQRHGDDWEARLHACSEAARRAGATADNADREAWLLFSQYVLDYNLQNHDIDGKQWQRAFQYVLADKQRLEEMELAQQLDKAEEAYVAAVNVFRTDVAQALLEGFDAIEEQINSLNNVLKHAPEFSNGERYQFKHKPLEQHKSLYEFLKRVREQGNEETDIFGGSGHVPEEFRALVEGTGDSELLQETSPLNDHRRFFSYDVEISADGKFMGLLSKRLGPGSGGEHRTPLYVIFGAALAAAYGKVHGTEGIGGMMLLDEAFEKMDAQNVRATAEYLNALGLQLIMAGPETDQPKMSSFLNVYYDMARFGSRRIQMTKNVVMDQARELLQSDNFLLHPELLEQEIAAMTEPENAPG